MWLSSLSAVIVQFPSHMHQPALLIIVTAPHVECGSLGPTICWDRLPGTAWVASLQVPCGRYTSCCHCCHVVGGGICGNLVETISHARRPHCRCGNDGSRHPPDSTYVISKLYSTTPDKPPLAGVLAKYPDQCSPSLAAWSCSSCIRARHSGDSL
jgi:hypothetical protein